MKLDKIKLGIIVAASLAAGLSTQAQSLPVTSFTGNSDQLLLGFTTPSSTGDLLIDLGTATQVGVGGTSVVDLIANHNVGQTAAALVTQLKGLYTSMNSLEWGVVGGHVANATSSAIYTTVAHGASAPVVGSAGNLNSSILTLGAGMSDFPGPLANQAVVDPTQGYGESWDEQVGSASGEWQKNATSPIVTTPNTFATGGPNYQSADLYVRSNSVANPAVYKGYFTLGSDGSLTFTPATAPVYTPPPPTRLSIAHSGNTYTISFGTTNNGAIYTLHYTNASGLTAHVTNWPASPTTVTGNGLTNSILDTTTDPNRFYRVTAH